MFEFPWNIQVHMISGFVQERGYPPNGCLNGKHTRETSDKPSHWESSIFRQPWAPEMGMDYKSTKLEN